jgi:hypothetical protein
MATVPSMALAGDADDDDKRKRFSLSLSGGIRPDMAGLGSTIVQDGTVDIADSSFINQVYSTDKALMSDRNNMTLKNNSDRTDSIFNVLSDYKTGGSLLGAEVGGDVRYELDDLGVPLFVKAGFYYTGKISGGDQSRTLGNLPENNDDLQLLMALNGLDVNDYVGGTMLTSWSAAWTEVPISVGVKAEARRPLTMAYGFGGVSIFSGGFDIGINLDEKYARAATTHFIENDAGALVPFQLVDQSQGPVQDTIKFRTTAVGLNYGAGVQAGLNKHVALFVELNSSGAAKTVFAQPYGDRTSALLTSVSSATLADEEAGGDANWFRDIAYPVVMQGASGRIGVRAYIF